MSRAAVWPLRVALPAFCVACVADSSPRTPQTFEDAFVEARRVALEEPEDAPLGSVEAVAVLDDGRLAVADRQVAAVRVHDADGRLLRVLGRAGEGPGELRQIADIAAVQGALWIADAAANHLTGFDLENGRARALTLSGGVAIALHSRSGALLVHTSDRQQPRFSWIEPRSGQILTRFLEEDSALVSVPYWGALLDYSAVPFDGGVVVAMNLRYPLLRFDQEGAEGEPLGSAPAAWMDARRPERGEFAGPHQFELLGAYLETFTTIDRLDAIGDSLLLVTHGRFRAARDPVTGSPISRTQTTMDAYGRDGAKRWEGLPVPGRILTASGDSLYALVAEPPAGWILAVYHLRPAP